MSLPTKNDVQKLDYSYMGSPWVRVATKPGIDLNTLDYSYLGQPFWGLADTSVTLSINVDPSNSSYMIASPRMV